ncbi:bifunctional [glutamine synthetase] adenylyltransferase/[glutamine synthetase]-adenylyl-L-tyrosine phosphorylase [Spongiactinospora sp. TRM90649]|uniref:bifunctional [glutamine synthetase] adenylyltransferase/[glutamine synthetase]-adenylyl-L-tyrosine phosphorylase n=1 Tax=Spongiactinospora sp. TRM90649 TaxID=3031114 RepID=UPI0023FA0A14|nr:bifunctional [glutamine synthetase] adenylyltransferase/[glutamine synthetase]-adenylyl-L-tyrosine phosphorylase [Spongiactinospora sp. TRM90649]MDF5755641.1 bifunctional [glutamine synthetase] adenylyltransferase/[glutamine synthetase]-adenylyl-L-tyrosine phosphorylase [Spongiactinospora sp. TRM90649]
MTVPRMETTAGRLARLGFAEGARAERLLDELGPEAVGDLGLLSDLVAVADPDLALTSLNRLAERDPSVLGALRGDPGLRERLLGVFGVSAALGEHVVRHPGHWRPLGDPSAVRRASREELRADLLRAVGADPGDPEPRAGESGVETAAALRVAYRGHLLCLAARDVTGSATFGEVTSELSDLAGAALEAGLAIARADSAASDDAGAARLAVIGMGKCGARELNYISDVDVVFVAEPREGVDETKALRAATRLAQGMMRACSMSTPEGALWEVDAALRPEGRSGPLVRTLASHLAYYRRWAKTWEFQALLKARPVAGDAELGAAYTAAVGDLVWQAATRENFVEDVQAMRRRVEAHVRADEQDRQLKLGPGGLRDIEFAVQLLQLVHGRHDPLLRRRATLPALAALSRGGYVGRDDAKTLAEAYAFLRQVEHLLQLHRLRRTHVVPHDVTDLRRIGRALGMTTDPVGEFTTRWKRHAMEARRLHEKLFYRPLLQAVARLPGDETRLSTTAAKARLEALGYADPEGALRHIAALTTGVSRRAAIQRTLLPVMLGWFADAPDPDAGLLGFRQVSDKLGTTPWYLRLLRDETAVASRMARLLGTSRYVTGLLLHAPEAVAMLGSEAELPARPARALAAEAAAAVGRHDDAESAVVAARALRRRELFRTAVADLVGERDIEQVGMALSELNDVTIQAALDAALGKTEADRGAVSPTRFTVIAMGRLGGFESSYASDADVMFVHDPLPGAGEKEASDAAYAVAGELRRLLAVPAPDPPLHIDPDLRPEGRQGPLVRSLASYAAYYARWSAPWEAQALLRARFSAGDPGLGERFTALIDPMRYPKGGLSDSAVRDIRRLKARMEAERLPRGADPAMHTKLGPGGLSDVEWVAQLIQLQHAADVPELRTTRTLDALRAAADAGLLTAADAETLSTAWRFASRIRDAIMLIKGRAGDSIPSGMRERVLLSRALGYAPDASEDMLDDYRRTTRRARQVVDRVFYGSDTG